MGGHRRRALVAATRDVFVYFYEQWDTGKSEAPQTAAAKAIQKRQRPRVLPWRKASRRNWPECKHRPATRARCGWREGYYKLPGGAPHLGIPPNGGRELR